MRNELDFGKKQMMENQIWIYATTNHFELITKYENGNIKYNIVNGESSTSSLDGLEEDIETSSFKMYEKNGNLETVDKTASKIIEQRIVNKVFNFIRNIKFEYLLESKMKQINETRKKLDAKMKKVQEANEMDDLLKILEL